ncbi:hypothetical protein QTP86_033085, partial [Hemibagrus guttatus]
MSGKMGKRKDLSEFDKGQIVMARRLDQSISKTADLVGCSRSAVLASAGVDLCKEGTREELTWFAMPLGEDLPSSAARGIHFHMVHYGLGVS